MSFDDTKPIHPFVAKLLIPLGHMAGAAVMSAPTLFLGHLLVLVFSYVFSTSDTPVTENFLLLVGYGLLAWYFLSRFLRHCHAFRQRRFVLSLMAFVLLVFVWPPLGAALIGFEMTFVVLLLMVCCTAWLMWFAYLPWWKPQWIAPRIVKGICTACGYDLRGSPSGICPECGTRNPKPVAA